MKGLTAFRVINFTNARLKCHPDVADHRLKLKQNQGSTLPFLDPDQPDVFVEVNHANRGMRSPEEASLARGLVRRSDCLWCTTERNRSVALYRAQGRLICQELQKQLKGQIPEIDEIVVVIPSSAFRGRNGRSSLFHSPPVIRGMRQNEHRFIFNPIG